MLLLLAVRVSRADRDAVAHGRLDARTIDVFFAAKIDNIDVPGDRIYGVTWRSKDGRYILVSGEAQPRTLTHELGHLFGLSHTTEPTSLMTSSPSPDVPAEARVFLEAEITRMKPTITRRVEGQRGGVSGPQSAVCSTSDNRAMRWPM